MCSILHGTVNESCSWKNKKLKLVTEKFDKLKHDHMNHKERISYPLDLNKAATALNLRKGSEWFFINLNIKTKTKTKINE